MTTASKEDIQWPSFEWRRPATIPSWPTTISKTKRSASKPRVCFPSCYPCRKRGITPRAGWPRFAGRAWTASVARCGNWKGRVRRALPAAGRTGTHHRHGVRHLRNAARRNAARYAFTRYGKPVYGYAGYGKRGCGGAATARAGCGITRYGKPVYGRTVCGQTTSGRPRAIYPVSKKHR